MTQRNSRTAKKIIWPLLICSLIFFSGCGLEDMIVVNTLPVPETTATEPGDTHGERFQLPVIFTAEQDWPDREISGRREGMLRPGITGNGKVFECSDDRVYFLLEQNGGALLCYGTHDSDWILPLCELSFCTHTEEYCKARFDQFGSVCYYEDYVYVSSGSILYRLSPDGTEREEVIDVLTDVGDYTAIENPRLWNGVFTFDCIPRIPTQDTVSGYFTLDGRMEKAAVMPLMMPLYNDGDAFLVKTEGENSPVLSRWYPRNGSLETRLELSATNNLQNGYWGEDCSYYLRGSTIYKLDYETGTEEVLFDTGLSGEYRLYCFPDCLLLCSCEDEKAGMYIYDWSNQFQGYVELPGDISLSADQIICGESRDRIYLAFQKPGVPEAYVDKYDFGTDDLELHQLEYHISG